MIFYDESWNAALGVGLLFAKREDRKVDVGIEVEVIGITVVSVVLIDPPAATHGKQQIEPEAKEFVHFRSTEDLMVACVVADKGQLPKHKGEEYSVDELKPKVIDNSYEGEAQSEQGECNNEFVDVVEGCLIQ